MTTTLVPASPARSVVPTEAADASTRQIRRRPVVIADSSRGMGIAAYATRGQGKSVFLGRVLAFHDFQRGIPLVVIDPIGGTIDNLLDKINRRPLRERRLLWSRVRYVNMNGQDGRVVPWPIYQRTDPTESYDTTARRFVDVLARADVDLAKAPIQGLNALAPLATAAGIILCALGLGITEMESLLTEPARWQATLSGLGAVYPDTRPAVATVQQLYRLSPREQENRRLALVAKLSQLTFSPTLSAMFGATTPGISWSELIRNRQAALLDFRDIESGWIKKFCLLWVYYSFVSFIRQRGHGRHVPISLVIDELSYLVGTAGMNTDVLTADVDELINRLARSHSVWLTIAGQELFQLPETLRQTVLSVGTLVLGQTADPTTAEILAHRFYKFDPYRVKKRDRVWGVVEDALPGRLFDPPRPARHGIVDVRTTEYTQAEQDALNSQEFLTRQPGHFLLGRARQEGEVATTLQPISIAEMDAGFPKRARLDRLRAELMQRDGQDARFIAGQIRRRLGALPNPADEPPGGGSGISRRPRRASE